MESYPLLTKESDIFNTLLRIIELREDDITELSNISYKSTFSQGFAPATKGISAAYSVGVKDYMIDADLSGGAFTATLDASPIDGQTHVFAKKDGGGNALTVSGNGKNINGAASFTLSTQYSTKGIIYVASADEWRIKFEK